jgi:hypothetical protein
MSAGITYLDMIHKLTVTNFIPVNAKKDAGLGSGVASVYSLYAGMATAIYVNGYKNNELQGKS